MTACPLCQNPIQPEASVSRVLVDSRAIRGKSTETAAQEERIVAALRSGPKTTDDLRRLGIYQSSARIFGLRQRGYVVETVLFDGYSADGYKHARMARYTLKDEPLLLVSQTEQGAGHSAHGGRGAACS